MRVVREQQTLVLSVNQVESRILLEILRALIIAYRLAPENLPPAARSVWYSTRGCESAKMSADESAEWVAALHEGKGALLGRLEQWVEQLSTKSGPSSRIRMECADAPAFLTAINDFRLLSAASHDIGEEELKIDWSDPAAALSPPRQRALIEIDFLAWMMELILQALSDPTQPPT